jgi:hypothetical protein
MSKVTLALGSFIVGACSMFLMLSGIHTSTWAQGDPRAVPVIPPLRGYFSKGNEWRGLTVLLDGMESDKDDFADCTIEYGGGAVRLTNATFSGPIRINLKGAALNTFAFLKYIEALEAGRKPAPSTPQIPPQRIITVKQPITADLISP